MRKKTTRTEVLAIIFQDWQQYILPGVDAASLQERLFVSGFLTADKELVLKRTDEKARIDEFLQQFGSMFDLVRLNVEFITRYGIQIAGSDPTADQSTGPLPAR